MNQSLESKQDPAKAPLVPLWPKGLPAPFTLQPGQQTSVEATCYPAPTDFVLDYHLLHWERYPGKCQRKLDTCWGAFEDLLQRAQEVIEAPPPKVEPQGWPTWKVVAAVLVTALAAGGIGIGTGYLFGKVSP